MDEGEFDLSARSRLGVDDGQAAVTARSRRYGGEGTAGYEWRSGKASGSYRTFSSCLYREMLLL